MGKISIIYGSHWASELFCHPSILYCWLKLLEDEAVSYLSLCLQHWVWFLAKYRKWYLAVNENLLHVRWYPKECECIILFNCWYYHFNFLDQGKASLFCEELDSKYFGFCGPCGVCWEILLLWCKCSQKQYVNEWT